MMMKTLTAATVSALLALSSVAFGQSSGSTPGSTGAGGMSGSGVGAGSPSGPSGTTGSPSGSANTGASTDVPAKCASLMGAERDKCLRENRAGATGGSTGSTSGSGTGTK